MIHEQHPDLILLDLKLDDLDGGHILAALRRDPRLREIPVIIYSAADVTPEVRAELETLHATIAQKSTTTRADLIALIDRALQQTVSPI
jgi:CheY-like chemotaxis protein